MRAMEVEEEEMGLWILLTGAMRLDGRPQAGYNLKGELSPLFHSRPLGVLWSCHDLSVVHVEPYPRFGVCWPPIFVPSPSSFSPLSFFQFLVSVWVHWTFAMFQVSPILIIVYLACCKYIHCPRTVIKSPVVNKT